MQIRSIFTILTVSLMLLLSVNQVVGKAYSDVEQSSREERDEVLAPFRDLRNLVLELLEVCDDPTDTDNDTLPDKVEWVIGTDHSNPDSDFDKLNDTFEVMHGMDPQKPDSNFDGMPDSLEVRNVPLDVDMDGVDNAWDRDNDDDGISDRMDLSPFHVTEANETFHFNISATGKPLYLDLQFRPKNPDHLRLIGMKYDWPYDTTGSMRDLDRSREDVVSTPFIEVSTNMELDPEVVSDYGMAVCGNKTILSINPVREDGMVVAFQGKVFIPQFSGPKNVEISVRMRWKITGMNDYKGKTLIWNDDRSIVTDENGEVNVENVVDGDVLLLNELGQGRIAFMDLQGMFLSLSEDGNLKCHSGRMDDSCVFVKESVEGGFTLKNEKGHYLKANADGTITAITTNDPDDLVWKFSDKGIYDQPMTLAVYDEDIILTGFSVEENYGTGVGMVYGNDLDMMNAANLILTYDFLRNNSNLLGDVPSILDGQNITCSADIENFDHSDEAMIHAMNVMRKKALDSLPEGVMLPVTLIMDDRSSSIFMIDILNASRGIKSEFDIDISEEPVIWSRVMKTTYYSMPADEALEMEEVMAGFRDMDLSDEALETILYYTVPWMVGDQIVLSIGTELEDFSYPEEPIAAQTVQLIIDVGITAITTLIDSVILVNSAIHLSKLAKLGGTSMFSKGSLSLFKSIHSSMSATDHAKFGKWNKFGKVMLVVEVVIAVGMSIFALVTIGNAYDWSAVGTGIAVVYSVMMLAYSIALIVIAGLAPPIGFIIAMIIALSDMIVGWICGDGWFQMFLEWFIGLFTDFNERSTVDLEMGESKLDINDKDSNGLTAGDRITYTANSTGIVTRTSDGSYSDVLDSYVKPNFRVAIPWGSRSIKKEFLNKNSEVIEWNRKTTSYTSGFWIEPGVGMVNFPTTFWLESDYRVYYEECWWLFGWWCDRESNSGINAGRATTMYFDVMPKDIDEFGSWKGITPLDADGDGINNTEEKDTHPWRWDSDGDGMCDKLEQDFGSDPVKPDTDMDGIFDRSEFNWFMDPRNGDTDSDGMSDFQEHEGWVVNFDFCGRNFNWTINADPRLNDTDGDGLNDRLEYLCKLNPRSNDTDGDGEKDRLRDYFETTMEYKSEFIGTGPEDMIRLENGTMLIVIEEIRHVAIVDENGTQTGRLLLDGELIQPEHVEHGPNGTIIISEVDTNHWISYIHVFNNNLTHNVTYNFEPKMIFCEDIYCNGSNILFGLFADEDESINYLKLDLSNGTVLEKRLLSDIPALVSARWSIRSLAVASNGDIYFAINNDNPEIIVLDMDLNFKFSFGGYGTGEGQFIRITDMYFDHNGDILVTDQYNHRIQKFESNGRYISKYGTSGTGSGEFNQPSCVIEDDGLIYVCDKRNNRIQILYHNVTFHEAEEVTGFDDTDGDGLSDQVELMGHLIDVNYNSRAVQVNVTSDPKIIDTDGDGLDDHLEWNLSSDPRSTDTDMDGIPDDEEFGLGTNLSDKDTDGDGLSDGEELPFLSSPLVKDTDGDGLSDREEFEHGCDPNSNDTDQDGLTDKIEVDMGWDPLNADPDGDFMFDSAEKDAGTSSDDPDKDNDGLKDGFEGIYETDPLSGDTDGDNVPDGYEVDMMMSPINNDTDGDGLLDGEEIELGSNPLSEDSDGDGIKDSEDMDFTLVLDEPVVVVHDDVDGIEKYLENLSSSVNVTVVDPGDIDDHLDSKYLVIVGKPSEKDGSAGNLTRSILPDDVLDAMEESDMNRFATRYGEWTENQTIIMLSSPYNSDHYRTLGMLKSMSMIVNKGRITSTYMNPRCCFSLDNFEIVKETGATIKGRFSSNVTFEVEVERKEMGEFDRSEWTGLREMEVPFSEMVEFDVIGDGFMGTEIEIFYSRSDLDRSGDELIDGPGDFLEGSLDLFFMNESSGKWERVNTSYHWVDEISLNTTDFQSYGMTFSGRISATLRHLSTYVIVGRLIEADDLMDVLINVTGERTVYVGDEVILDASGSRGNGGISNFTWFVPSSKRSFYGSGISLQFDMPGSYDIHLFVLDQLGLSANTYVTITVLDVPPAEFTIIIGPVEDKEGNPLQGVLVEIIVNSSDFSNITDESGFSSMILPVGLLNQTVTLRMSLEGYITIVNYVRITPDGEIEENIPYMSLIEEEADDENGFPYWILIILLLLIIAAVVVIVVRRKSEEAFEE